jgi:hypothetical protein
MLYSTFLVSSQEVAVPSSLSAVSGRDRSYQRLGLDDVHDRVQIMDQGRELSRRSPPAHGVRVFASPAGLQTPEPKFVPSTADTDEKML